MFWDRALDISPTLTQTPMLLHPQIHVMVYDSNTLPVILGLYLTLTWMICPHSHRWPLSLHLTTCRHPFKDP